MIQVKTKYIILGVAIAILGILAFGWHLGNKMARESLNDVIQTQEQAIKHYITVIGDDSILVAQKEQTILTQRQALKAGEIEREELKKLNFKSVNEITRLKLRIDTLLSNIDNNGTIITIHDTISINDGQSCILLPFKFSKKDKYLDLAGSFTDRGILSISLNMDIPIDIWIGQEKKGKKPIFVLTTKNTYIKTLSINSIKMDVSRKKKWGVGFQAGYGIMLANPIQKAPYVGIGLSRNFIRF